MKSISALVAALIVAASLTFTPAGATAEDEVVSMPRTAADWFPDE